MLKHNKKLAQLLKKARKVRKDGFVIIDVKDEAGKKFLEELCKTIIEHDKI